MCSSRPASRTAALLAARTNSLARSKSRWILAGPPQPSPSKLPSISRRRARQDEAPPSIPMKKYSVINGWLEGSQQGTAHAVTSPNSKSRAREPRMTVNPAWAAISGFFDAVGGSRLGFGWQRRKCVIRELIPSPQPMSPALRECQHPAQQRRRDIRGAGRPEDGQGR